MVPKCYFSVFSIIKFGNNEIVNINTIYKNKHVTIIEFRVFL
jgi:hypothetical protein